MQKKIILPALGLAFLSLLFIPVTENQQVRINASFLTVYNCLLKPQQWERWRTDIGQISDRDSAAVIMQEHTGIFTLRYADRLLNVSYAGSTFDIRDQWAYKAAYYTFIAMPGKELNTSEITVTRSRSLLNSLLDRLHGDSFAATHINELKRFLEIDSLRYGCSIFKTKVPGADLLEIKHTVPVKERFWAAEKMFLQLRVFINARQVKQTQPVIAQFLMKSRDSTAVNVGVFIDRKINSSGAIIYTRMPKGGPLYAARYSGKFNRRQKVYEGLHQYFADHLYQSAILPFETYLDNKLPTSDTDQIRIQVNFTSWF